LSDLLVVVTRWFGGVKLGTGGLVRAYGGVAKAALDTVARRTIIRRDTLELRFDYPLMTRVLRLASDCEAVEQNRICDTHVRLSLAVARSRVSRLEEQLIELMQGQGEIRRA
jgi:putative IMPACT (imprinted ancient) family translation regulator